MVVNNLYYGTHPFENKVNASFSFDEEVVKKAVRRIYEKKFNPLTKIDEGIFNETWNLFNRATDEGFGVKEFGDPDFDFYQQIRYNNAVFSAFRTHRLQNDIASKLLDENGKLKPFEQFSNDVQNITDHNVRHWLRTEYDTAILRAHQAADWKQFDKVKDILPNLRWMPTTSVTPDLVHKRYWEVELTLPQDHAFWKQHRPGDRWNCKCSLEATDDPVRGTYVLNDDDQPNPDRGLDNNPGQDARLFSDTHPYNPPNCAACTLPGSNGLFNNILGFFNKGKGGGKDCYNCPRPAELVKKAGVKFPEELRIEANKQEYNSLNPDVWKKSYFDKDSGGYVAVEHERILHSKKSKNEKTKFKKEYDQCMVLAKNGQKIKFISDAGGGFDIYLNDIAAELKRLSSHNNIVSEAKDAVRNKKAKLVVFEFEKESKAIYTELLKLKKMGISGRYWYLGEGRIYDF